jgi:hypothetical protein
MAKRVADPVILRSIHVLSAILGDFVEIAVEAEAIARRGDQKMPRSPCWNGLSCGYSLLQPCMAES